MLLEEIIAVLYYSFSCAIYRENLASEKIKFDTSEIITPHCDDAFRSPVTILFCLSLSSVLVLFDLRAQVLTLLGMQHMYTRVDQFLKGFLKLRRIKYIPEKMIVK